MRAAVAATHHGFEAIIAELPERRREGPRRALGRGRLRPARPPPGQRRRLRLDLRRRRPREHAALDQEHRRRARGRPRAARRRRRGRLALHRRHHPHAAGRPAPSPTPSARSTTPSTPRRRPAMAAVKPGNKFSDVHAAAIRVIAEHLHAWGLLPEGVVGRGHARQGARAVPPALDGARHLAPPRPRRARLRAGHPRGVHGRRARAGHGAHRRAGPVLQGRRPARPGALPRHRRAHRGRRASSPRTAARTSRPRCRARSTDVEAWIAAGRPDRADARPAGLQPAVRVRGSASAG